MALNISLLAAPIVEPITLAQAKAQCRIDSGFTSDDVLFSIYIPAARQLAEKLTHRAFFNQTWKRTLDNFPLATSFDYARSPADKWNAPLYGADWNRLAIDLPMGRALAINSITYTGCDGAPVTLSSTLYNADLSGIPCRLTPSQSAEGGLVWPFQSSYLPGSVAIQWQAGSYDQLFADSLPVVAAGDPATYTVTLSQNAALVAGTSLLTSAVTLVDSDGNAVAFTGAGGVLTVNASYTGQTLKASYSAGQCPADILLALLLLVGHFYRNPEATTDLTMEELPLGIQALLSGHVVEWTDYRPC